LSASTASVICNHLGYNYTHGSIFDDERFGRSTVLSSFNHKYCSSNHIPLSQCVDVRKGSSCYISVSQCTTEYGLRCYNPGACSDDGQIRLVNGTIEQEGRVEICLNGVWGAICDVGWSTNDAYVFCRGIGYNGQGPFVHTGAFFGETYGPILWSVVSCTGYETQFLDCNKLVFPAFNCTQQNSAGVTCKDGENFVK
jgi:deleted-in-malignant-brain-tumors protein 1